MPRVSSSAAIAALWHFLKSFAATKCNRKQLTDGRKYPTRLHITGIVAGYAIDEHVCGTLSVSAPITKATSTGIPQADLVAFLLQAIPSTQRYAVQRSAIALWAEVRALPVSEAEIKAAKSFLKETRLTESVIAEGPVSVETDPDPDDLAVALDRYQEAA